MPKKIGRVQKTKSDHKKVISQDDLESSKSFSSYANPQLEESNLANLGNYESDSSGSNQGYSDNSFDHLDNQLKQQKKQGIEQQQQRLQQNLQLLWGSKKQNFYGRNKEEDEESDTDDDQDELQQAQMLQKIKASKISKYMSKPVNDIFDTLEDQNPVVQIKEDDEISVSESDDDELLGDKLLTKTKGEQILKQIQNNSENNIEDLQEIVYELKQMAQKLQQKDNIEKDQFKFLKKALRLKKAVMKSYKTYLSFWLLWKYQTKFGSNQETFTNEQDSQIEQQITQKLSYFKQLLNTLSQQISIIPSQQNLEDIILQAPESSNPLYESELQKLKEKQILKSQQKLQTKQSKKEQIEELDKAIQRNVQREIIKNKGLTRRRKKVDRNPRVKKRLKFEQMEKRRRSTVREFKADRKAQLYQGETTGIKTGLVRGIKM